MKLLLLALALAAGCGQPSAVMLPVATASGAGVVERVVDGDTISVGADKIRIRGLDTPETHRPGTPVQCFGPEATDYAKQMLLGKHVRLVTDPGDLHDRYGRLVAEVWTDDGRSYALEAVRAGMGKAYVYDKRHPASNSADIAAAQDQAQAEHVGMWGHCG